MMIQLSVLRVAIQSVAAGALVVALTTSAQARKNVALVIGNSAYVNAAPLKNPKNDAADMAAVFRSLGFEVHEHLDLDRKGMERALNTFSDALEDARVSVFYYAGHAMQVGGKNYLIPVDAPPLTQDYLFRLQRIHLANFQRVMERKTKTNILFLDACRDNPLGRGLAANLGTRSGKTGAGLAKIQAGIGTLISYATQPGAVAADGFQQRNSPYTASLKTRLLTPRQDLILTLRAVRNDVIAATNNSQVPWVAESLTDAIVFRPNDATAAAFPAPAAPETTSQTQKFTGLLSKALAKTATMFRSAAHVCGDGDADLDTGGTCVQPGASISLRDLRKGGDPCPDCPELVAVPIGQIAFANLADAMSDPVKVRVRTPFLIGRHEVSFDEWDACVEDGGCDRYTPPDNGWGRGKQPVINVSFEDALRYVKWLSSVTGAQYTLPTEAQWEYAARAKSTTRWWWGDEASPNRANFDASSLTGFSPEETFRRKTVPIDSFDANPWGLKNTHGNVAEWTSSCASEALDPALNAKNSAAWVKKTGANCDSRIARGGGWDSYPAFMAANARRALPTLHQGDSVGFRVVREAGAIKSGN